LNINVEIVSTQQVYGGPGVTSWLYCATCMPVVTALHTVREPNADQRAVMKQLDEFSTASS
jgi:hypothetical protein